MTSLLAELEKCRLKFLVVEPAGEMRTLLKAYLAPIEASTRLASCEREGLALAKTDPPDVMIAACGGYEDGASLCNLARQAPGLEKTLFIVTTTSSDPKDFYAYFEKGADQVVMKPFRSRDIYAAVKTALVKRAAKNQSRIHVLYKDGGSGFVEPHSLDQLIARHEIVCFRRGSGVALIGRDPVRAKGRGGYKGPERRSS